MKNKRIIMTIFAVGTFLAVLPETSFSEVVNVGNKICPVSNQAIGSMGEGYKVEYEGKEYNLCCEMCVKDFRKNPEKYAAIAEAEGSGAVPEKHSHGDAHGESGGHGHHGDHSH